MKFVTPEDLEVEKAFSPDSTRRRIDLMFSGRKLVHYTSAANAINILRNKSVWLRNVRCMNDFMEVNHGIEILRRFFTESDENYPDVGREDFIKAIDDIHPGISNRIFDSINPWLDTLINDSYIACISEHSKKEDENGRLSMWRSYGAGSVGVAIVINPLPLYSVSDALNAYSSPVSYQTEEEFFAQLRGVASAIRSGSSVISKLTSDELFNRVFNLLLFSALCLKHPGFEEEKEWRIIHIPKMWPSKILEKGVEVVGGVPQNVYKIPLRDISGEIESMTIPDLVHRVIIGPTAYPLAVYEAIVDELSAAGVANARDKVVASRIPLRVAP